MLNSILKFCFAVSVPQISQMHKQKEIKAHEQALLGGHLALTPKPHQLHHQTSVVPKSSVTFHTRTIAVFIMSAFSAELCWKAAQVD